MLDGYRDRLAAELQGVHELHPAGSGVLDELIAGSGVRAGRAGVLDVAERLGPAGLLSRSAEARRLLEDDGVTYGGTGPGIVPTRWELDPLPLVVTADEWRPVEAGFRQRSELLGLVLEDLYGPRELLRQGVIPPDIVLGHPGFLRAVDGITTGRRHPLFLAAADLARDGDGRWQVLSDRTQAPSGAGYAMENRRVVTQVLSGLHRDTPLAPLRPFFDDMRTALRAMADGEGDGSRVVLLTPGAASETAFDQAFLATLLGFPLVEADDLVVQDARLWMRTTGDLEPVDVVLRRVDAEWCDPLELRPDSQLGLAGLIEAGRRGTLKVANPLGAGVLENPGLLPFLPAAARALLGTDLDLPSVPTWWCGDPTSRSHVLANLDRLVVKPIGRARATQSRFGWMLTADRREDLRQRIEAEPWAWVGQEAVPLSTAPTVGPSGLEPRRVVLRTFAVAGPDGYTVLPGGLGRVAGKHESHLVSNLTGAVSKDVWVLSEVEAGLTAGAPFAGQVELGALIPLVPATGLSPRVADDLFWMGRYAERAEGTARLLRVLDDLVQDYSDRPVHHGSSGHRALQALLAATSAVTYAQPAPVEQDLEPRELVRRLALDTERPGSVAFAAHRTIEAAQEVREQLSLDTWLVLGRLERTLDDVPAPDAPLRAMLAQVVESLLAFSGLSAESIVRDDGWAVTDAGRRVERALHTTAVLRSTLEVEHTPAVEAILLESVLLTCESIITYRRRQMSGSRTARPMPLLLGLLLLDTDNPRSVAHQVDRLAEDVARLRAAGRHADRAAADALDERLREVVATLRGADAHVLAGDDRARLTALLDEVAAGLRATAVAFERAHFAHKAPQLSFPTRW